MAGYNGYSMSNNAVQAYSDGEKPRSKWTKSELLEAMSSNQAELCKALTKDELISILLYKSSWHHSSKFYNCTDFYSIDFEQLEELTAERVADIVANRKPKAPRTKAEPKAKPTFITAYIAYDEWEGTRKHPKKVIYKEVVTFMSNDKMINVKNVYKKKRLTSVNIICKIEQKTKFATAEQLKKKFKITEL